MRLRVLQLAVLVLLIHLIQAITAESCGNRVEWMRAARESFSWHANQVRPTWEKLKSTRGNYFALNETIFSKLAEKSRKEQCLVEVIYSHKAKLVVKKRSFERSKGDCKIVGYRADIYVAVFNWIVSMNTGLSLSHDFLLFLDVTDGHSLEDKLYKALSFPILGFGRGADKAMSLPIPEYYMVSAMKKRFPAVAEIHTMMMLAQGGDPHNNLGEEWWEHVHNIFTFEELNSGPPWFERRQQAIYRGRCVPTADPNRANRQNHLSYLLLRPEMCQYLQTTQNPDLFDVAMERLEGLNDTSCADEGKFFKPICEKCEPCIDPSKSLSRGEIAQYKYIINVDGFGPTFDAIYWKLASGSVVVQVSNPGPPTRAYYLQWFSPLLVSFRNYIAVEMERMEDAVSWCTLHDDRCQKIGEAGRKLARCKITLKAAILYLEQALQLVHDIM